MRVIKHSGNVERNLTRVEGAVAFNVAGHSVDDMGHRYSGIGVVSVIINDRRLVDGGVHAEGEEAFIPVNVTKINCQNGPKKLEGLNTYPDRYASTPLSSKSCSNAVRRCAWYEETCELYIGR